MRAALMSALFVAVALAVIVGCGSEPKTGEPASEPAPSAATTNDLHLSDQGRAAIGLATAQAAEHEVHDSIAATGWLAPRPGSEVVIKAPTTGFIVPTIGGEDSLGRNVTKDEVLAELRAFLSPQEQSQLVSAKKEADVQIEQSQATSRLAEEQLKRVEDAGPTAVPGTRLMELRETIARSRAAEQGAREKLPYLPDASDGAEPQLRAIPLNAPFSGRLTDIHFAPRQLVVQGDPLWTIADWSRLWIRVPVFVADVSRILQREPAAVMLAGEQTAYAAKAVDIAQGADPGKQTVELLYEIDNRDGRLRPGEAVSVSLPSGESSRAVAIPRSAILWDGMGNSWVYLQTAPGTFRRGKVELGQSIGSDVVVRRGLGTSDTVVTRGAEALYGEEFKGQLPARDKD
jgi:cobalt-zinc-cadmium efflux system membrane fusion protein